MHRGPQRKNGFVLQEDHREDTRDQRFWVRFVFSWFAFSFMLFFLLFSFYVLTSSILYNVRPRGKLAGKIKIFLTIPEPVFAEAMTRQASLGHFDRLSTGRFQAEAGILVTSNSCIQLGLQNIIRMGNMLVKNW
jgi:hypothetical protein